LRAEEDSMTQDHGALSPQAQAQQQQQAQAQAQQVQAAAQHDPLLRMLLDVRNDRLRLRQTTPTIEQLQSEVTDTALSYVEDLVGTLLQLRNWTSESLADVDDRLNGLEAGGPLDLDGELAEKITKLCGGCRALAEATLQSAQDEDSRKVLTDLIALCDEVMNEILGSDDDDEGDDDGGDDDDGDDGSDETSDA